MTKIVMGPHAHIIKKGIVEHVQDDASLQHQVCNIVVDYLPMWMGKLFQQPKCDDIYDCKC
jgi:hypothetical protein